MEAEGSLLCLQELAFGPSAEASESSTCRLSIFPSLLELIAPTILGEKLVNNQRGFLHFYK
jgi:hypothetical protein